MKPFIIAFMNPKKYSKFSSWFLINFNKDSGKEDKNKKNQRRRSLLVLPVNKALWKKQRKSHIFKIPAEASRGKKTGKREPVNN